MKLWKIFLTQIFSDFEIVHTLCKQFSWSYYVELLKIDDDLEPSFYEKQYIKKMRSRDTELNINWGTICTPPSMVAADGKIRKIQASDTEGMPLKKQDRKSKNKQVSLLYRPATQISCKQKR